MCVCPIGIIYYIPTFRPWGGADLSDRQQFNQKFHRISFGAFETSPADGNSDRAVMKKWNKYRNRRTIASIDIFLFFPDTVAYSKTRSIDNRGEQHNEIFFHVRPFVIDKSCNTTDLTSLATKLERVSYSSVRLSHSIRALYERQDQWKSTWSYCNYAPGDYISRMINSRIDLHS